MSKSPVAIIMNLLYRKTSMLPRENIPHSITMHHNGVNSLKEYVLSNQSVLYEKECLDFGNTLNGMRIIENNLLEKHQFVITDRFNNILCVGSIDPSTAQPAQAGEGSQP
jgi:hypothetical protein